MQCQQKYSTRKECCPTISGKIFLLVTAVLDNIRAVVSHIEFSKECCVCVGAPGSDSPFCRNNANINTAMKTVSLKASKSRNLSVPTPVKAAIRRAVTPIAVSAAAVTVLATALSLEFIAVCAAAVAMVSLKSQL